MNIIKLPLFLTLLFVTIGLTNITAQKPLPKIVSGGVVNGKAISLPKPEYPPEAIASKINGTVNVQVTIDEQGNIISASAVSGHQLLRKVCEEAALKAKFHPTKLSGQHVKVTGVIIYSFVAPPPTELKEPYWALGMFITFIELADQNLINEIGNPQEFDEILADIPKELPQEFSLQKELFLKLTNAPKEERNQAAKELRLSLDNNLQGHQAWQFELGVNLGKVLVEIVTQRLSEQGKNYLPDEIKLKTGLQKIKELTNAPPNEISKDFVEKFKTLGDFADEADLISKAPLIFQAIDQIFSQI